MKIILLSLLFLTGTVNADVEVSLKHLSDTSGAENFNLQSWRGVEVKYQQDKDSLFYFISHETANIVMLAPAFDIEFIGLGLGFKKPVTKSVNVYGQIGYYIVDTSLRGRFNCENYSCGEGLYYGLNSIWGDTHNTGLVHFNEYEIVPKNGYGITFGIETLHQLTKNTSLTFGVEYRALSFTLGVHGMSPQFGDYDVDGQRWETSFKGVDSANFKVGMNYGF